MDAMLNERQIKILLNIIKEYIETAEPVGSVSLMKRYSFSYSPATIRAEMLELENMGFLFQPHTSAGRVPTDKAYKFFTEYLLNQQSKIKNEIQFAKKVEKQIRNFINEKEVALKRATKVLSLISENLAIGWSEDSDDFFSTGVSGLLKQPEFTDEKQLLSFGEVFDKMESEINEIFGELESDGPEVFIGSDIPIEHSDDFSLIASKWNAESGEKGVIAVFGPKRMDYKKNISLVEYLAERFENL